MQATAIPITSSTIQYAHPNESQPIIPPDATMNPTWICPPVAEHQAKSVNVPDSIAYIYEIPQNVAIVEKQSPAGTVFIPIQPHLSSLCANFFSRKDNNDEYTLGEICLALMSTSGYGRANSCVSSILYRLQVRLMDATFKCCEQGQLAQLLLCLDMPIKIRRQGSSLIPPNGTDQLEDARFERLLPCRHIDRTYPGYYYMYVSLPAFGGYVLATMGTPEQLLCMVRLV